MFKINLFKVTTINDLVNTKPIEPINIISIPPPKISKSSSDNIFYINDLSYFVNFIIHIPAMVGSEQKGLKTVLGFYKDNIQEKNERVYGLIDGKDYELINIQTRGKKERLPVMNENDFYVDFLFIPTTNRDFIFFFNKLYKIDRTGYSDYSITCKVSPIEDSDNFLDELVPYGKNILI